MAQQIGYYTEEGLQKLKDELHLLRTKERKIRGVEGTHNK